MSTFKNFRELGYVIKYEHHYYHYFEFGKFEIILNSMKSNFLKESFSPDHPAWDAQVGKIGLIVLTYERL